MDQLKDLPQETWKIAMMALVSRLGGNVKLSSLELQACANKQFQFVLLPDNSLVLRWPDSTGGHA